MYQIIVIDDNQATANMIAHTIDWAAIGCVVCHVAYSGEMGRNAIIKYKPDLIITDISMPDIDGLKMVELTQELVTDAKIIFISAYDKFKYAQTAISLHAFGYVLKPFSQDELVRLVEKAVAVISRERKAEEKVLEDDDALQGLPLLLKSILEYIHIHVSEGISLEHLSRVFDISPSYISTLIRKYTGKRYMDFLTDARMKKAKLLLKNPRYRVEEVSSEVGYKNYITFYRVFVQHFGTSPSNYRDSIKE